jgi:hypothetical protein
MRPAQNVTDTAVLAVETGNEERAQPWKSAYPQTNAVAGYKIDSGAGGPKTQGN